MTFLLFCNADKAAAEPAAPAPITTTSASASSTSLFPLFTACLIDNASTSPPACLIQSATASKIALLVIVAPLTVSTPSLCCSTILCGIFSRAGSAIPSVSVCSVISTLIILLLSNSTFTSTMPLRPLPVPV